MLLQNICIPSDLADYDGDVSIGSKFNELMAFLEANVAYSAVF